MDLDNLRKKFLPIIFKLASEFIPGRKKRRRQRQIWWYRHIILPHIASSKMLSGLNDKPRQHELIVSLTSYPARIRQLHACIFSLLDQSVKADRVILWLAESQFPNREKDLPEELLRLCSLGLDIRWYQQDIRSYKKLIPTLQEFPEAVIITADDDFYYPQDYIKTLYEAYIENPNILHCHRAHWIKFKEDGNLAPYLSWEKGKKNDEPSFSNFCTTGAGVIFPPHSLHSDVLRQDLFTQLSPTADDIWFWAMAVANGTKIHKLPTMLMEKRNTLPCYGEDELPLNAVNCAQGQNDVQLAAVIKKYPEILQRLHAERKLQ